jgi:tetratricopeptide (TPR) repeat protein
MMLAFLYAMVGRPEGGYVYAKQAVETDPLNPLAYCGEWWIYQSAGRFDKVCETCLKMYNLDKDNLLSTWSYANALAFNNKVAEATSLFDSMMNKYPDDFYSKIGKAQRYAINNEKEKALESITEHVEKAAEMDHLWAWILADVCSLIGEKERAIDYLERATRDIFIDYPFFSAKDPFLENIRHDERFKELMERVKKKWEDFKV